MKMPDWLVFLLVLGIPFFLPIIGLWWLHRRSSRRPGLRLRFYHLSVGGAPLSISSEALIKLALIAIPILWVQFVVPILGDLIMFLALLPAGIWFITKKGPTRVLDTSATHSHQVVTALRETQKQIEAAKTHIEKLESQIHMRQFEVEATEVLRTSLRQDIEKKLGEVEAWQTLSEQQKTLFIQVTNEAMRKRSAFQMLGVVVGSIILNLTASVIWSLMGAPGQKGLQQTIQQFKSIFL